MNFSRIIQDISFVSIANNIFCRSQKQWVKDIDVIYGNSKTDYTGEHTLPQDINKGFQGKYVFLRPTFTTNRMEAATKFNLLIESLPLSHRDLALGSGGAYRYILPVNDINVTRKISRIWLSEREEGDGYTGDINRGRGGRYLFLNWSLD